MTDNIGGSSALLFMYGPAALGGIAGALIFKNHRVVGGISGALAGFGVSMAIGAAQSASNAAAVGAQNAKTLPAAGWSPLMPPSTAGILTSGSRFSVMGEVPPGWSEDAVWGSLTQVGWVNIVGQTFVNAKDPKDPNVMMYSFVGTWNGQANMPVPNDVSVTAAPAGV